MLVQQPRLASGISDIGVLEGSDVPGAPLLLELIELLQNNPNLSTAAILERYRQAEAGRHLARLAGEELSALGDGIQAEFDAALRALARQAEELRLRARRSELEALIGSGDASAEEKQEYRRIVARLGRSLEDP
jgi:DNA primase